MVHSIFDSPIEPRTDVKSTNSRDCTACGDTFSEMRMVRAPCAHYYCNPCMTGLFTSSMTDESLMPPRCCRQSIPLRSVAALLGPTTTRKFEGKQIEFGTPNRLYCPVKSCSAFMGPASTIHGATRACPSCYTRVCAFCKIPQHSAMVACGDDKDAASKMLLELGQREGWKRCGSCRRLVELSQGW